MTRLRRLLTLCFILGWPAAGHAQDVDNDTDNVDRRLQSLKADLLDATPGVYASPLFSGALIAADVEADGLSTEFEGYLLRGGGAVGYQMNQLRMDLEATFGYASTESDDAILEALDQDNLDAYFATFTANGYLDIPVDLGASISDRLPSTIPYVGAGLGWVYINVDEGDSGDGVLTQLMAGLGIRLSPHLFVDTGYRYFYIPRIELDGADNELGAHTAEVKLRYRF